MTDLSPGARAVLEAVTWKRYDVPPEGLPAFAEEMAPLIAAAIRAAADQAQASAHHASPSDTWAGPSNAWGRGWEEGVRDVAKGLLAIAAELECAR